MTAIPSTIPQTSTGTISSSGGTGTDADTSKDYMDFLHMLTTELQNQDPTSPMDTTSFTQQLIGFSQIQQQVKTNGTLTSLLNQSQSSNVTSAVSYINQIVKAQSDQFDVTNNVGYVSYNLPQSAASVSVSITDSSGKVLDNFSGATTSGMHDYAWNGVDSSGNKLPDGTYKFNVTALDATGQPITGVNTFTTGLITSVDLENGQTTLHMGNGVSTSTDISFTTDQIAAILGTYATTPTVANPQAPSTTNSIASAVSDVAKSVADAL